MSIRSLITEGIGPGSTIRFLLTGGLAPHKARGHKAAPAWLIQQYINEHNRRYRAKIAELILEAEQERLKAEAKEIAFIAEMSKHLPTPKPVDPIIAQIRRQREIIRDCEREIYLKRLELANP